MDPLFKVKEAHENGIIPDDTFELIKKRFELIISGIDRIEKASNVNFPIAYVDPSVVISKSKSFQYGILFARTIPFEYENKVNVMIQISAPLVAYGLKGTIHAILAHEFLHYLELISRISNMEMISDEISSNLFENVFTDNTKLFKPQSVFNDKTLISHITKRFPLGFHDYKLESKTEKFWIKKNLPVTNITLDTNTTMISSSSLSKVKVQPKLLQKLKQFEQKNSKTRNKKYY
jgi:hypothetical protein